MRSHWRSRDGVGDVCSVAKLTVDTDRNACENEILTEIVLPAHQRSVLEMKMASWLSTPFFVLEDAPAHT